LLPELEAIVARADFRLFLSSMPTDGFPVSIVCHSINVTKEPPRGICTHLLRLFFRAGSQERKKFCPLGFNGVSETDFAVTVSCLRMFLDEQESIPWDALHFMTGEIPATAPPPTATAPA
jgi:dynein heavy chain